MLYVRKHCSDIFSSFILNVVEIKVQVKGSKIFHSGNFFTDEFGSILNDIVEVKIYCQNFKIVLSFKSLRNQFCTLNGNFVRVKIQFEGYQVEFSKIIWQSLKMLWLHVVSNQNKIEFFECLSWLVKLEEDSNFLLFFS